MVRVAQTWALLPLHAECSWTLSGFKRHFRSRYWAFRGGTASVFPIQIPIQIIYSIKMLISYLYFLNGHNIIKLYSAMVYFIQQYFSTQPQYSSTQPRCVLISSSQVVDGPERFTGRNVYTAISMILKFEKLIDLESGTTW